MVVSQHAVSLIFLGHTAVSEANYVTLHKVFKRLEAGMAISCASPYSKYLSRINSGSLPSEDTLKCFSEGRSERAGKCMAGLWCHK